MRWIARAVAVSGALLLALLGLALLTGHLTAVSTHGISMEPGLSQGDLVLVRPGSDLEVGDVVAYRSELLSEVVLHRIVAGDSDGFVLQGDNNAWLDPERPAATDVIGVQVLHLPSGGIWLSRITSPPALAVCALLVLGAGSGAGRNRRRHKELAAMRTRSRTSLASTGLPHALRPVAAGATALVVLGLGISAVSWSRSTTETVEASTTVATAMQFGYSAQVPQTPAYDDRTVRAPLPLFRSLVDTVDVSYDYAGQPGVLSVHADLSTASGWASRIELVSPTDVGGRHTGSVSLDLSSLERRAREAAAVIGIPAGSMVVAVVPTVDLRGGGRFAPELALSLDSASLSLTGPLTAAEDTSTSGRRQQATRLSALGRSIEVSSARVVGLVAVVSAALLGLLLLALTRLSGPVAEADRIRRRYGDAITTVLPVALVPGSAVVDVPSVRSLVRLAESWQLPVLHWSRSSIDTFLVLADGVSYRHRVTTASPPAEVSPTTVQRPRAGTSWAGAPARHRRGA